MSLAEVERHRCWMAKFTTFAHDGLRGWSRPGAGPRPQSRRRAPGSARATRSTADRRHARSRRPPATPSRRQGARVTRRSRGGQNLAGGAVTHASGMPWISGCLAARVAFGSDGGAEGLGVGSRVGATGLLHALAYVQLPRTPRATSDSGLGARPVHDGRARIDARSGASRPSADTARRALRRSCDRPRPPRAWPRKLSCADRSASSTRGGDHALPFSSPSRAAAA